MDIGVVSELFGPNPLTARRWYNILIRTGAVIDNIRFMRASRFPAHDVQDVEACVKSHPTFCIEELHDCLRVQHPNLRNTLEATICRSLYFNMILTRKKLTKEAREAALE